MFESNPLIKVLWKDHASIMASNFIKILQHEQFLDVHIRHADRTIAAHRVVLAASSELFREQLASAASAVTSVELSTLQCADLLRTKSPDAVFAELELIVQIVYRGWADLRERSIASLLDTARCLQFTDVCEVLQRTAQARANAQHAQHVQQTQQAQQAQHLQHMEQQQAAVAAPPGAECLEQLTGGEVTLRALQEALLASEPSCLLAPELAELAHLAPLAPASVERGPEPPPSVSALRHEDAAVLTAAGLCEVVQAPPTAVGLTQQPPMPVVSVADETTEHHQHQQHGELQGQEQQQEQQQGQEHEEHHQEQGQHQQQERPHGSQDGAPLLRVRTQFELHCPWGLDMEMAGRGRQDPEQGSAIWSQMLMPAPPPPPPPPPPAAPAPVPLLPGGGGAGLAADEELAIIDSCGLPPSTPETLERFDENDFSGLTEEEKSPMPPKAARVRRFRRRAPRIRTRKLPALIALDQSTVCQVCHRDFGRMAALQRHLAAAHADRAGPPEPQEERPPASTVDASAIADPRDTCASLLQFRPRLTAPEMEPEAVGGERGLSPPPGGDSGEQTVGGPAGKEDGTGQGTVPVDDVRLRSEAVVELRALKYVFDAVTGLPVAAAVTEGRESGASGHALVPEPGQTPAEVGRGDCVTPAGVSQEGDAAQVMVEQENGQIPVVVEEQAGQTVATVDQAEEFKCVECAFSAVTEPLLRSHVKREHSAALLCPHCQLQFRQAASLYRHVATAHPEQPGRPSQCVLCPYQSDRPSQVRRHLRDVHGQDVHGRPLPLDHRCLQCDYATCSALKLKVHVRRQHTTDKQFKCSECSYSSVEKQALAKHFRIVHTDHRPYRCEICDFRTSTLSRITRHRRSHTQERPHTCGTCGQRYADRRRLREHERLRHEPAGGAAPLPFVCHFCGMTFARRDNMVQHIGNRHKAHVAVS